LIKDGPPPEMKTSSVTPKSGSDGGKANKVATLTNNHLENTCSLTLKLENAEAQSRMEDVLVTVKDWSEEDEQMEKEMIEELGKKSNSVPLLARSVTLEENDNNDPGSEESK